MKDLSDALHEVLGSELDARGFDVVDLVPIPARGDRMVRIQTLDEALSEFDRGGAGDTIGYLIQVRPKRDTRGAALPPERSPEFSGDATDAELPGNEPARSTRMAVPPPPPPQALDGLQQLHSSWDEVYLPNGKLNVPQLVGYANLLLQTGDFVLARNIFRSILASGEKSGMALYGIGQCFEGEGKLDEARSNYEESITYHPTLDAYRRLASVLARQKKDELAADALDRATSLKGVGSTARLEFHKEAAAHFLRAGKAERAEKQYRKALEIDPLSDSVRAGLGQIHLQAQNYAEARRMFQDALASNPKNAKALSGLASCLYAQGDKRSAHDYFAKALEIDLNNPTAVYYIVKCAYELKSYATAARHLGDYVQGAPVSPNLLFSLAGLQYHLGRIQESGATVEQILQLQPDHAGARELKEIINRYVGS